MASSKSPKHDFAPAWLKIPDDGSRGSRQDQHDGKGSRGSRREDFYAGYGRYAGADYNYQPLQRQRSFENYYDERRYSPQKFRHHSMDDEYYGTAYGGYPCHNGYNYDKYSNHYRSQPTLYRDGKYQHPNARYGQMNGAYPPYFDPYYDYYHGGDPYYNGYQRPSGGNGGKRLYTDKETHPAGRGDKGNRDGKDDSDHASKKDGVEDLVCSQKQTKDDMKKEKDSSGKLANGSRTRMNEESIVNGLHDMSLAAEHMLSSSLEAEQRLLKEMGWNEADDEEYEITEDDRKEFQNLSQKIREKKNGQCRNLAKPWSPQHMAVCTPSSHDELNDTLSSTSDESDED